MRPLKDSFRRLLFFFFLIVSIVIPIGCGTKADQANLDTANSELEQAKAGLATAQVLIATQATTIASSQAALATTEALVEEGKKQNDDLSSKLDASAKQLNETKAELEEVQFAADNLLNKAEVTLQRQDVQEAQRLANLLNERYPGSPQAIRASEIVTLIVKAIAENAAAEKERLATATNKMRSENDSIRGITFYEDQTTTDYTDVNSFHLYIGKDETKIWMRLRIQYTDDDWLFMENFTIRADDQRFDITATYSDIERDNGYGAVWEWYDGSVRQNDIAMLKSIIASNSAILRYNGQQYYFDREITTAEKQALQNVLDAFVALGGDLDNP